MSDVTTVTVKILDKEYQVSCPRDEVDGLTGSARHLDEQMRAIRESGKVFGLDRIAVMAALNIAHELLALKSSHDVVETDTNAQVVAITERLAKALSEQRQPDL